MPCFCGSKATGFHTHIMADDGLIIPSSQELMDAAILIDPAFDEGGEPTPKPAIVQDEYAFIEQSLQRYRDRDYRHTSGE